MKKFLATAIAGTLLVTATGAAMAQPYRGYGHYGHYDRGYHRGNAGAAIGLGLGLFALGAVIASSNRDYGPAYRDYGPAYYVPPPPPPPPPVYRYGYDGYYYNR
jgi:hypothetical protein